MLGGTILQGRPLSCIDIELCFVHLLGFLLNRGGGDHHGRLTSVQVVVHQVLARLQPRLLVTAHREHASEGIWGRGVRDTRHTHLHLRRRLRSITTLVLLLPDLTIKCGVFLMSVVSRRAILIVFRRLNLLHRSL